MVVDFTRRGQLPLHLFAVFAGLLVDEPNFQRFLGRVSSGIAFREVLGIKILRQRLAYGEFELEQVFEGQTQRRHSAVDVACYERWPSGCAVTVRANAFNVHGPRSVFVALPENRLGRQVFVGALIGQQFIRSMRDCMPMESQVIRAVFRAVDFIQANFAAGLQFLDVRD